MSRRDPDPNGRYCIKYVAFHPGLRPSALPTLRHYVRGKSAMKTARAALRETGCTIISVTRTNWFS